MLMDKLNEILNSAEESSLKYVISQYIKQNIDQIATYSIQKIADDCFTSKGQISKFIHNIGYDRMADFKYDCIDYIEGIQRTNHAIFSLDQDAGQQLSTFTQQLFQAILYCMQNISINHLQQLIHDIQHCQRLFVYGHGHARYFCTYIQNELSSKLKEVIICDVDFIKTYTFKQQDVLLFISVNGNTFSYEKEIIQQLNQVKVNTWLMSCNSNVQFRKKTLIIPSHHILYNDYVLRHILDFILKYK